MPEKAPYVYHDLKPPTSSFLEDVIAGLSSTPKALAPKYFYDERGSKLFDMICELPEYYPTRTELAMLDQFGAEIAIEVGRSSAIVEYGSGAGRKTAVLIRNVAPAAYVAIDISSEQLLAAIGDLAAAFPAVSMTAVCADYTRPLALPGNALAQVARRVVFFPGSTIGNFTPAEAHAFLLNARDTAGPGGGMLVGVDLKKSASILHAAYNDARGVTAAFNLNLLRRMNGELAADFDLDAFEHRAFYTHAAGRIEMHLVSTRAQQVAIAGYTFSFEAGESIHTENSYKYSVAEFQALASSAGFVPKRAWMDPEGLFSIHYLAVPMADTAAG